jgi:beta-fructofuranosidase
MVLQLSGRWVWDFWLAADRGLWHVFYLYAAQTPDDPDRRHFSARIGHAVSADLRAWQETSDALGPGRPGSWDDMATWTGSVIEHPDGGWAMLYTGVGSAEDGLVQRIGLARSADLHTWVKHPQNPVVEADPRWYEMLNLDVWFDQAWRDPWAVLDVASGLFHAFITARSNLGDPDQRGVIGHATSPDLTSWVVGPPIRSPQGFGYMEVPQVLRMGGRWHLLFSAPAWAQSARPAPRCTGTFHAVADEIEGPYDERATLACDAVGSQYGGKVLQTSSGPVFLAFRNQDSDGRFLGGITNPTQIDIAPNGAFTLVESPP